MQSSDQEDYDDEEQECHNRDDIKDIKELTNDIQITNKNIRKLFEKNPKYAHVVLLGSTGVGKSALDNANISSNGLIYFTCEGEEFEMGHEIESKTSIPNIYSDEENQLLICDAPGFDDTRGINQDNINSFAINQLFDSKFNIKRIFIISAEQTLIQSGRAHDVSKNLERIVQMIPDEKNYKRQCHL
ncbi:hypothetical protein M9Y10_017926 [Tritrichomonas musculus]|uniref:G domain-containing protein n=1 Tax=Tritrichomonas musculus TaxID=1915356 RepID=A0ABR2HV86_9EUKA